MADDEWQMRDRTGAEEYTDYIDRTLRGLEANHHFRSMVLPAPGSVDFTSNDYLGLARKALTEIPAGAGAWGSAGSRLLAGNHEAHERLEQESAQLFRGERALLFSSGYLANMALLSTLPRRGDTLLLDELCHASLREAARLSLARSYTFRHNDLNDLERLARKQKGAVFVVTEALFSMDGDYAPLAGMAQLCFDLGAYLILDEAHSTGIMGPSGAGLACELQLQDKVFARVHTFGKAIGRMGAVIVSSQPVTGYLVNKARSFIYSTAMPPGMAVLISVALAEAGLMNAEREQLKKLRTQLGQALATSGRWKLPEGHSPIVPVMIPGNEAVRAAAKSLQDQGLDVRPVLSPTVPAGTERLRVILHAFNSSDEVRVLAEALMHLP